MTHPQVGPIESRKDFKKTPSEQYRYWSEELKSSQMRLKEWHKQSNRIISRYIDDRHAGAFMYDRESSGSGTFRLNLFHSNIATLNAMMYGNLPQVDVSRRYADANDDIGRVAAEMIERLLNNDIADNAESYNSVLRAVLQDRLLPGMGCARVRYKVETETLETENGPMDQVLDEDVVVEYVHWRDMLWSYGRTFSDIRWVAFRSFLTKDEVRDRFSDEAADTVELKRQQVQPDHNESGDPDQDSAWSKAEIWEIWDRTKKEVVWVSPGYDKVLETQPDPLGLNNFYPCPPFFLANPTTTLYKPTPDFHLSQDLYNAIDVLQTRIAIITEAVKVVGVYDESADGVQRMFKEGIENDLIPVSNWALFGEKGGIQGSVDWVPLGEIVGALDKLRELRDETIGLLQQITGMSDIMRGQLGSQYEGVGQSEMKVKFGSIRIQALQDDFASFVSDLLQLKAEIISRHYDPEMIVAKSNMNTSYDAELIPQAVQLIKHPERVRLKVEIRSESVAMVDYAQLKAERTDYINALAVFLQSAAPLMEAEPGAKPYLLQLLQWGLAGFKGASEIEGVLDKAIEATQQQDQQQKPDPEQQKMQAQQELEKLKAQIEMQKIQAKAKADMEVRQMDLQADIQTSQASAQSDLVKIQAETQSTLVEIAAKMKADVETELIQSQANAEQSFAGTESEIRKEVAKTELEIAKMGVEHELDLKLEKAKPKPEKKDASRK